MADDFSFNCPKCGQEPKRGVFLGSEIWHDECLIEDLIAKSQAGTPREEIEKTLKRVKNKKIESAVGLGAGWPEYQPQKTAEELEAEYQAELAAAEAAAEAEKLKQEAESADVEVKAKAEAAAAEAAAAADEAAKQAEKTKKVNDESAEKKKQQSVTPSNLPSAAPALANAISTPSMGVPQPIPSYTTSLAPAPMAPTSFMAPMTGIQLRPAPQDEKVRKIAIEAMDICLQQMRKDVEYGKLLWKMLKEFNWDMTEEEKEQKDEERAKRLEEKERIRKLKEKKKKAQEENPTEVEEEEEELEELEVEPEPKEGDKGDKKKKKKSVPFLLQ